MKFSGTNQKASTKTVYRIETQKIQPNKTQTMAATKRDFSTKYKGMIKAVKNHLPNQSETIISVYTKRTNRLHPESKHPNQLR